MQSLLSNEIKRFFETNSTTDFNDDTLISIGVPVKLHARNITTNNPLTNVTFSWFKPNKDIWYKCFDSVYNIRTNGENRLEDSRNESETLLRNAVCNLTQLGLEDVPLIVGGIKFSYGTNSINWNNFADSDWFVPKFIFYTKKDESFIIYNFTFRDYKNDKYKNHLKEIGNFRTNNYHQSDYPSSDASQPVIENEKSDWVKMINTALDEIKEKHYTKVVLSRKVSLNLNMKPDLDCLLSRLSTRYPNCFVFAFQREDSVFLGASPEKLATMDGEYIEVDALAGSLPRSEDEDEDLKLGENLLNDKKNCAEHKAVVDFILESLQKFATNVEYKKKPVLRKLANIQHLWTPMRARAKDGINMFELIKSLHPTPAICGSPWEIARNRIIEFENFDRGMFTGVVGWFNQNNVAEFAVSIRCGLLKDNQIHAFAGCGIVDGSEPISEFEETNIKLKPVTSLFQDEKICQS